MICASICIVSVETAERVERNTAWKETRVLSEKFLVLSWCLSKRNREILNIYIYIHIYILTLRFR